MPDLIVFLLVLIFVLILANWVVRWYRPSKEPEAPTANASSLAILEQASVRAKLLDFLGRLESVESRLSRLETRLGDIPSGGRLADWAEFRREVTIQLVSLRDRLDMMVLPERSLPQRLNAESPISEEQLRSVVYNSSRTRRTTSSK
jgi:hypothetical protein